MKKERITSDQVAEAPPGLWSNCLVVGSIAYFSGLTARQHGTREGFPSDEYGQAKAIFRKMKALLTSAGGSMDDIVKLTIFVTNIARNTEIWRARQEFFTGDFPTCSLVEVRALAVPEVLVEIEGVAHLGSCQGVA